MDNHSSKVNNASFVNVSEESILRELNAQLEYASSRSSFYAHLEGTLPLRSLEDISSLPFISADDITRHGREMLCVSASQIRRIVSLQTSGTLREPKRLYFTDGDLSRTVDFFAEGMGWMCEKRDKVGILLPCTVPDGVGDLLSRGLEALGALPLRLGLVESPALLAETLMKEKPAVLVGMPWQIRLLALALPDLRPKAVLLSADYVPESIYALLEDIWSCRVLSHFGMTESCFGCAVESMPHRGMYLRRDELYAEIVDPVSEKVLPAGETGELVLTTLRREAMPLIRYRTGDFARLSTERSGSIEAVCGRIATPTAFYTLQEKLCPMKELLDYSLSLSGETLSMEALVSDESIIPLLENAAAEAFGKEEKNISLTVKVSSPLEGKMFTLGKRTMI